MTTTIDQIYAAVTAQLGSTYKVLDSYDATDTLDPTGTLAVSISDFEHLDHNGCDDYRFRVSVSGITLADEDKSRSIIRAMEAYVMRSIDLASIQTAVDNCAGAVMETLTTQSDGDSNEFTLNFDLYVAPAVWTDSSDSSVDGSSNSEDHP